MNALNTPVSREEFTRVELDRRIAVLEGLFEAYSGHLTPGEWERLQDNQPRRNDVRDLLNQVTSAARDVQTYAEKLRRQLEGDFTIE